MRRLPHLLVLAGFASFASAQHEGVVEAPAAAKATAVDFARQIRPLLAQHCIGCHGPDDKARKAELRLDRRDDAFAERDGGAAFVAGDPAASLALARVLATDPDERMPPPEHGEALKPAQVELLRRWLADGAPWSEHWAFVPPVRPPLPAVADASWCKNEFDRFVLARLDREGLRPSPEASRDAWLRRVTFDLIGLPPTPAELDAFATDTSADAYDKVVDRLLADERYGERMASDWLDLARYADSSGYQRDTARQAWKWRDQVIKALNDNQPFDQFTIEQLAGDLLPEPTLAQRIASGFNRNHPVNTEAGEELDEYRSAYVIDRVHTTATTWLGLSVGCAQCHDHKYDPISQREFYRFYDFFNHVKEKDNGFGRNPKPAIAAPGPEDAAKLAELERRIRTLKRRLDRDDPLTDAVQAEWEQRMIERIGAPLTWTTLVATERMARHGSRLQQLDDGSVLASGPVPARDTYELVFTPGKRTIHALRLEVLPDPSLPHGASGRADDGRFILDQLEVRFASVADSSDPPPLLWAAAQADINQQRDEDEHYLTAIEPGSIESAVGLPPPDAAPGSGFGFGFGGRGWSVAGDERKEARQAVLVPLEPLVANETSLLRLVLQHDGSGKFKSLIGRFRVSCCEDPRVRTLLVPVQPTTWRALGPFAAPDADAAYATAFAPEADFAAAQWKKKYDAVVLPKAGKPQRAAEPAKSGLMGAVAALFGQAAKPGAGKPPADDGKPDPAPAAAEPAPAEIESEAEAEAAADDAGKPPKSKKPPRLSWAEHRDWRDGHEASLPVEGPAVAWFVARKLTTPDARTVALAFTGGVGAKVWLNGDLVGEFAPAIEAPPAAAGKDGAAKKKQQDADEDDFAFAMRDRQEPERRRLQLGLKAGDNHLVFKLVARGKSDASGKPPGAAGRGEDAMAIDLPDGVDIDEIPPAFLAKMPGRPGKGGLSFACSLQPEGDDRLDYATMLELRARAATPPRSAVDAAVSAKALAAGLRTADDEQPKAKTTTERRQRAARRWFRTRIDIAGAVLFAELKRLEEEKQRLEARVPSALVMEELKERRTTRMFTRGDYRKPGDVVTAGTPTALPPMPNDLPKNRLGLARWLVLPEHPLTARVQTNRMVQQFFGLGLVRTADDFGLRGMPPSHPELLDWLATEFVRRKWDPKAMHRLLVLSATYRQSSAVSKQQLERDPDNVLLGRGPGQRLSAEMLRDQALATSGLLVQKLGGKSVKPFQPKGLWNAMLGGKDWQNDPAEQAHRRGLYVYWKRGVPYPSAMIFDASKRETCTVTRTRTTTPLQALVTLNDPVFVEAGKALGLRLRSEVDNDDARLVQGFRMVTSRTPDGRELGILRGFLADQRTHYGKDLALAKKRLGIAEPKGKGGAGRGGKPAKTKKPGEPGAPNEPTAVSTDAAATNGDKGEAGKAKSGKSETGNAETGKTGTGKTETGKPDTGDAAAAAEPAPPTPAKPTPKFDPTADPAEAAAWAQVGCTLLNLDAAIRRG